MVRRLYITTLFVLAPAALCAQTASDPVAAGVAATEALDPAAALAHFEQALAADSADAEAAWRASIAAVDVGKQLEDDEDRRDSLYLLAEQLARHAVATDSLEADGWFALSNALGRTALSIPPKERIRQAAAIREAALRAIELDPRHDGAYHVLGRWHAEIMRLSGVTRFFARRFMGARVFDEASWEAAVENLERAVELNPTYIYHRLDLAEVLAERREWDAARRQLEAIAGLADRDVQDPEHRARAAELLEEVRRRG